MRRLAVSGRLAVLVIVLFAKEAHVSGGYGECFTDVDSVVCIESDSRKRFVDDEQAREWIGGHRLQAEALLKTLVPRLRASLAAARSTGVPVAAIDDWRLRSDNADGDGPRRVQLELGTIDRQIVMVTVTTTRALTEVDTAALRTRLQTTLSTPSAADAVGEDVGAWQPLWRSEPKVEGGVRLGIGTTQRVSPLAVKTWTPWLRTQLQVLRAAWAKQPCSLPKGRTTTATTQTLSHYREVDAFRPWGPLLLDGDVQARVDDGAITRMARLVLPTTNEAVYGALSACLTTAAGPLPPPPSRP